MGQLCFGGLFWWCFLVCLGILFCCFPDKTRSGNFQRKNFKSPSCLQKDRIFILDRAPHSVDYTWNHFKVIYSFTIVWSEGKNLFEFQRIAQKRPKCRRAMTRWINSQLSGRSCQHCPENCGKHLAIDHLFSTPVFLSLLGENWWTNAAYPLTYTHTLTHSPSCPLQGPGRKVTTWLSSQHILHLYHSQACAWKREKNHWSLADRNRNFVYLYQELISLQPAAEINLSKAQGQGAGHKYLHYAGGAQGSRIYIKFSVLSDNLTGKQNKSDHPIPTISCYSEVNLDFPN